MSKDPYKIVDSKPSWSSKLGSGIVALGSVATAIVITVPGFPGYQLLGEANAVLSGTNPIDAQGATGDSSVLGQVPSKNQNLGTAQTGNIAFIGSVNSTQTPVSGNQTTNAQISEQLTLPGVSSGNTTSPTPGTWSGSGSNANAGGSTASGNTTSPTPGGSGSSYENDDDYEDDDEDDDYDDEDDDEDDEDDDEDEDD